MRLDVCAALVVETSTTNWMTKEWAKCTSHKPHAHRHNPIDPNCMCMWLTPKFPQLLQQTSNPLKRTHHHHAHHNHTTTMVLKIRLARFGRTNAPFYNIVVAHARYLSPPALPRPALDTQANKPPLLDRTARNSRPLEVLGTYDPIPKRDTYDTSGAPLHKDVKLDIARAMYWIGVGAQPSDTARRLLSMVRTLVSPTLPT